MFAFSENRNRLPAALVLAVFLFVGWVDGAVKAQGLPFDATVELAGLGGSRKVARGEPFGFLFCLRTLEAAIDRIELSLALPPEVERLGGETFWKGDLEPGEERCLDVALKSRTTIEKWSRPFHAQMKFVYQGMNVAREVNWTDQGLNDTDFVSK